MGLYQGKWEPSEADINQAMTLYGTLMGKAWDRQGAYAWLKNPKYNNFQEAYQALGNSLTETLQSKPVGEPGSVSTPVTPRPPTTTTPPAMPDWEKNIRDLYESSYPEIESSVKSAASQRGGLDTGGYLTSIAKGKASSWQDMLKALIGQQNYQQNYAEGKRQFDIGQTNLKEMNQQNLLTQTALMKSQEPNAWANILAGAGAGAAFGPWGAVIGGLSGWGAKQGLFGR